MNVAQYYCGCHPKECQDESIHRCRWHIMGYTPSVQPVAWFVKDKHGGVVDMVRGGISQAKECLSNQEKYNTRGSPYTLCPLVEQAMPLEATPPSGQTQLQFNTPPHRQNPANELLENLLSAGVVKYEDKGIQS